jgi:hypothetical protein
MRKAGIAIYIFLLLLCSCKTQQVAIAQSAEREPAVNKMACRIKGQITKISISLTADPKDICAGSPCIARVKILAVQECGSSVSNPVQQSDTIDIKFIYGLADTRAFFPGMKAHYPGMKEGNIFWADLEFRLKPGTSGEFVVYGYTVEKQ